MLRHLHAVRPTLLSLLAVAALPTAASAETVQPMAHDGPATCLRATGAEGGLALSAPSFDSPEARTALSTALPDGFAPGPTIVLGRLGACASVAAAGDTQVVAAPTVVGRTRQRISVVVHDPGAPFGAPTVPATLPPGAFALAVTVAASPRGDAAVAWTEVRGLEDGDTNPESRLRIVERTPGGAFGLPRTVSDWRPEGSFGLLSRLALAYDASGALTFAWTAPHEGRSAEDDLGDVEVATGAPGALLGPPREVGTALSGVERVSLAVSPDRGALLAFDGSGAVRILERAPGAAGFVSVGQVPAEAAVRDGDGSAEGPVVALRDGGDALVAWEAETTGRAASTVGQVLAMVRTGRGAFGPPQTIDPGVRADDPGTGVSYSSSAIIGPANPPYDGADLGLQAALGADGRFALGWGDADSTSPRLHAATLRADGSVQLRSLDNPCREPADIVALLRSDGPAVAFADDAEGGGPADLPYSYGRLHVAGIADLLAVPAAVPAPKVRARVGPARPLRYGQTLRVPVVCDRACDMRVVVPGRGDDGVFDGPVAAAGRPARAGLATSLVLDPHDDTLVDPRRHGVPLRVTACSPDGGAATTTTVVQPAQQVPARPGPVPLDVHARRVGGHVVVTWRIAHPLRAISFAVIGVGGAHRSSLTGSPTVRGALHTHFRAILRPKPPATVTKVTVLGRTNEAPMRGGHRTVKVEG